MSTYVNLTPVTIDSQIIPHGNTTKYLEVDGGCSCCWVDIRNRLHNTLPLYSTNKDVWCTTKKTNNSGVTKRSIYVVRQSWQSSSGFGNTHTVAEEIPQEAEEVS